MRKCTSFCSACFIVADLPIYDAILKLAKSILVIWEVHALNWQAFGQWFCVHH